MIEALPAGRLIGERMRDVHREDLCRMHRDSRVMATLGGLRSAAETREAHRRDLDHWDRYGYGIWVFRDLRDGRFAGRAGLRHVLVEGVPEVELAYAFMPEFWGRGLATETARAILGLAFGRLALEGLVGFTLPTNLASRRVMEKAGFRFDRDVVHADLPHLLYRSGSFLDA
jgi:[ribosomal protein S5]-alanine N-acetyltransferase